MDTRGRWEDRIADMFDQLLHMPHKIDHLSRSFFVSPFDCRLLEDILSELHLIVNEFHGMVNFIGMHHDDLLRLNHTNYHRNDTWNLEHEGYGYEGRNSLEGVVYLLFRNNTQMIAAMVDVGRLIDHCLNSGIPNGVEISTRRVALERDMTYLGERIAELRDFLQNRGYESQDRRGNTVNILKRRHDQINR